MAIKTLHLIELRSISVGDRVGTDGVSTWERGPQVVSVPDLSRHLGTDDATAKFLSRWTLANQAKSTINTLLIDEKEKWEGPTITRIAQIARGSDVWFAVQTGETGALDPPKTVMEINSRYVWRIDMGDWQ